MKEPTMPRPRILICDDEEGVRESLRLILEERYDVDVAEGGAEAVAHVAQQPYQLLFLDIKMPQMDGLETLKRVRKLAPTMPVVILTAYQSMDIAKQTLKLGANDYLSKPFDRAQILDAVKQLLACEKVQ